MRPEPTRKAYREARSAYLEHANGYEIGVARDAGAAGTAQYADAIAVGLGRLQTSVDEHLKEGLPGDRLRQTLRTLEGILAEVRAAQGRLTPGHERVDGLFIEAIEELQRHTPGGPD